MSDDTNALTPEQRVVKAAEDALAVNRRALDLAPPENRTMMQARIAAATEVCEAVRAAAGLAYSTPEAAGEASTVDDLISACCGESVHLTCENCGRPTPLVAAVSLSDEAREASPPCPTCIAEAEEIRVVGRDHRNVSNAEVCPDCGRPWSDDEIKKINAAPGVPAEPTTNLPGQIIQEQAERIEELEGQLGASGVLAEGAKAQAGECGKRYFHETAHAMLECCRDAGHPGCHEGYTGTPDQPRDCEWRWWDPTPGVLDPEGIEALKIFEMELDTLLMGLSMTPAISGSMNVSSLRPLVESLRDLLPEVRGALTAYLGAARPDAAMGAIKRILDEQDTEWAMEPGDIDQRYVANVYARKLERIFAIAREAAELPERSADD